MNNLKILRIFRNSGKNRRQTQRGRLAGGGPDHRGRPRGGSGATHGPVGARGGDPGDCRSAGQWPDRAGGSTDGPAQAQPGQGGRLEGSIGPHQPIQESTDRSTSTDAGES